MQALKGAHPAQSEFGGQVAPQKFETFQSKVLLIVVTAEHCKIVANWSRSVAKIVVRFASLEKLVK